jgi:hypothetical protein
MKVVCSMRRPVIFVFILGRCFLPLQLTPENVAAYPYRTIRLTGCQVYWQSGAADCWTISFFEEVAVRGGSFKPK